MGPKAGHSRRVDRRSGLGICGAAVPRVDCPGLGVYMTPRAGQPAPAEPPQKRRFRVKATAEAP